MPPPQRPRFRFLVAQVTPYRKVLILALLLLLAESGLSLLTPWIAGQFTDRVLNNGSFGSLLLIWLGIVGMQSLVGFGNSYLLAHSGAEMLTRLRNRVYDHLQALPLSWHHERRRGEVLALLTSDVERVASFVTGTLIRLFPLTLTFFGALALMFVTDARIALLAALLIPLFYLVIKLLTRRIRPLSRQMIELYAKLTAVTEENLAMLAVIKAFVRESVESDRYREHTQTLLGLNKALQKTFAALSPMIQFLATAGIVLLLWLSTHRLAEGTLSPGDLVTLLMYGILLTRPVSSLASVYGEVQATRGAAERLLEAFAEQPEPMDGDKEIAPILRGEIEFRNVRFGYPGRNRVLDDLTLHIGAGDTVAITGPNGAGKSTIAHLLMRLLEPERGRIAIDGQDIRAVSLTGLRAQIGLVAQNVLLFNATVAENIGYGRTGAGAEEIEQAARAAHAHAFIKELPEGYQTLIGDQGIRISGGQKQRIALARALLKDPPILVLDEATAMFDPEGEEFFLHECRDLLHRRTVILITHRPASLKLADRILRLAGGRVTEVEYQTSYGPHDRCEHG